MKNVVKRSIGSAIGGAAVGVLMLLGIVVFALGSEDKMEAVEADVRKTIEGVWIAQFAQNNCQGTPLGLPNRALFTFNKGGTMSETLAIAQWATPPFHMSPGHGVWKRHNWEAYSVGWMNQRVSQVDLTFAGYTRSRAEIGLSGNGDEISGTLIAEIVAPNGTVLATICAVISGTRFE